MLLVEPMTQGYRLRRVTLGGMLGRAVLPVLSWAAAGEQCLQSVLQRRPRRLRTPREVIRPDLIPDHRIRHLSMRYDTNFRRLQHAVAASLYALRPQHACCGSPYSRPPPRPALLPSWQSGSGCSESARLLPVDQPAVARGGGASLA